MKAAELEKILPPPPPAKVYLVTAAGAALCGIAFVLSLISSEPGLVSRLQLALIFFGCTVAGAGLSWNAKLPLAWGITAVAFLISRFAMPAHWDSARIVVTVASMVCAAGTLLTAVPMTLRRCLLSVLALVHFGAIYSATTLPEPTPWTSQQLAWRVYWPYMKFMYLSNAYHFYSPEPGPASLIFVLVTYEKPIEAGGKSKSAWHWLPNRREHLKDPMALTYYRRLSITEQLAQSQAVSMNPDQWQLLWQSRNRAAHMGDANTKSKILWAPNEFEPQMRQYRPLRQDIARYVLPGFADYLLRHYSLPDNPAVSVKIYRLEHRVLPVNQFANTENLMGNHGNPYHPTTYRPYYLGEYWRNPKDGDKIELKDPQDPLLYWLVPILPRFKAPEGMPDYVDYMSEHAGFLFDWEKNKP